MCAAQEQQQQCGQEEVARQHQADLVLQEELRAAQEQQHQEEVARQHQEEEAAQIQQELEQQQQQIQGNFTVQLKDGQQQQVDPFMNMALKKVRQSPKVMEHSQVLKRGKDDNHDSIAGKRKQACEGMRKSMRNIVL